MKNNIKESGFGSPKGQCKTTSTHHPNIGTNKHPNLIINIIHPVIMIKDESPLHPPLPFLRLLSSQHDDTRCTLIASASSRRRRFMRPRNTRQYRQYTVDQPKCRGGMIIVTGIGRFVNVAHVGYGEDDGYLGLG